MGTKPALFPAQGDSLPVNPVANLYQAQDWVPFGIETLIAPLLDIVLDQAEYKHPPHTLTFCLYLSLLQI